MHLRAHQLQVAVQLPKRYKPHTNSSKAGSVCPLPFQLTDVGYRCAEADPPTTFLGPQPTVTQVGVDGCVRSKFDVDGRTGKGRAAD